jgi:hypothetical protein
MKQAKLTAIAKEFGTIITKANICNTIATNCQADRSFTVLSHGMVKGECGNDIEPPQLKCQDQLSELSVTSDLNGCTKEFTPESKTEVSFYTCSSEDPNRTKTKFKNGEFLNAHFFASKDGFLSVYYLDHTSKNAVLIFPLPTDKIQDNVPIKADKGYILFNNKTARKYKWINMATVELRLLLRPEQPIAMDEVVAVFSTESYSKPLLQIKNHDVGFGEIPFAEFETWVNELTSLNNDTHVNRTSIEITK